MRIKFVSQYFHPEPFSNANIANSLLRAGHSLSVLTAVPNYGSETFLNGYSNTERRTDSWNGVPIERVWTFPRGKSQLTLLINYFVFVITASWRAFRVKKGEHDLVFVSLLSPVMMAIPAIIIARRLNIPLVYWLQDLWPESALMNTNITNPLVVKPLTWLCGWIYRQADLLLVQSEAFPAPVQGHGVPAGRIDVFPNTAPAHFRPMNRKETERPDFLPRDGFNLMYAGNIGDSQGWDNIVETAHGLRDRPDINFVFVGSGRALSHLKQRVDSEGLADRFTFAGRYDEEAMPGFFAHADAMLLTLQDFAIFDLTVPYKTHTYLASGRPIVGAIRGEGARIIEAAGAGFTAEPADPEALAMAIKRMADTPFETRQRMGLAGRAYFDENYNEDRIFGKLRRWLEDIEGTGHCPEKRN